MKKKSLGDVSGYLFILPAYIIFVMFMMLPIFVGIYYSFTNYNFYNQMDFVGFDNYKELITDEVFLTSVRNTLVYSFFTVFPQIAIGLVVAQLLFKSKFRGKQIFRTMIYMPNVTSMVAISLIWSWILDPTTGFLNRFMILIGLEPKMWLMDPTLAMGSLIVISLMKAIGYNMVVYLSGFTGIPDSLYEAADIDGANGFIKFFKITIPLLKPTTFFLFITATINSFKVFEQVNILTNGGPYNSTTTMVHQIYKNAFENYRIGYASAMGTVLFVMIGIVTIISFKFGSKGNDVE